ncbi:MAG: hypothetical protein ABSG79_22405 [Bryobacteraceae bacterium]
MAHLLIVDDDASTLASLARAFRLAGHEATVCDNAARALELLKSQPFDMLGAVDFLEKPLSTDKLLLTVDNVLKLKRLEDENRELRQRVGQYAIVYSGEAMRRVMAQVDAWRLAKRGSASWARRARGRN